MQTLSPGSKNSPEVSIITVTYNAGSLIRPTIESVTAQTYASYEYLVIDGQSSDDTLQVLSGYQSHISCMISEPDQGVYDAMNKGLAMARGKYVLFLNAGDELAHQDTLSKIFASETEPDIWYGETIILSPERKELGTRSELTSRKLPQRLVKSDFLNGQVVSHQSFIARRKLCPAYDLRYNCSADIQWMLSVINKSDSIHNVGMPISKYLQGGISDRQLTQCWKERFLILAHEFGWIRVILRHVGFAMRYLKNGAYKQ